MTTPRKFTTRISIFLLLVLGVIGALHVPLGAAFMANPVINGVIVLTWALGIVFAYRRIFKLYPEISWIKAYRKGEVASGKAPQLMAPTAKLLLRAAEDGSQAKLSAGSMRSVLDGIATRLDENREIGRYLTGILVLLGLLGTFWGLLEVLPAIATTIRGLTVDGTDTALMFDELKAGLEGPLSGMATAFSSSLFGLAGSLTLGFFDLQAGQAQNRFYNDVEDWLAGVSRLSRADDGGGLGAFSSPSGYLVAVMEQTAEGIDKLTRALKRQDEDRKEAQSLTIQMTTAMVSLSDKLGAQADAHHRAMAHNEEMAKYLRMLSSQEPLAPTPALDDASREHLRNLDVGIRRLGDGQVRASELLAEELRSELKLLSRTMAVALEEVSRRSGEKARQQPIAASRAKVEPSDMPSFVATRGDHDESSVADIGSDEDGFGAGAAPDFLAQKRGDKSGGDDIK